MRVRDLLKLYMSFERVTIEIHAEVTVFNSAHYVLVDTFAMDCTRLYNKMGDDFLAEELIGFDIVNNKIRIYIKGDRE